MSKHIPIEEQANVPGGLMSLDPGTVPGQRPPNFGKQEYSRLEPIDLVSVDDVSRDAMQAYFETELLQSFGAKRQQHSPERD